MLEATDPQWPKDSVGFNRADAPMVQRWLDQDRHWMGAYGVAQRLKKYSGTQLDNSQAAAVNVVLSSAIGLGEKPKPKPKSESKTESKSKPQSRKSVRVGSAEVLVGEDKSAGEVLIRGSHDGSLRVYLDPPWENPRHSEIKNQIKTKGAKFDPPTLSWVADGTALVDLLSDMGPVVADQVAIDVFEAIVDRHELSNAASLDAVSVQTDVHDRLAEVLPEGLALYPFQEAGVAFLEASDGRALLGDQMGLGKTPQSLAYLALHPEQLPAVIVVPAVVTTNWVRETQRWVPGKSVFRLKNGKDQIPENTNVVVVSYDIARRRVADLRAFNPGVVIADESQCIKNYKAKRTQAVVSLVRDCGARFIALSGTPILNRPVEFYTTLSMLRPSQYSNWWKYTARYCGGHRTRFGYECSGATNTSELATRLKDLMVRRTKDQVLTELPAKQRGSLPIELKPAELRQYRKAANGPETHLEQITAARRAIGQIKVPYAAEIMLDYADQGVPVLMFAHHKDVLDALETACRENGVRYGRIDGSVSHEDRGNVVEKFQAGDLDVMLISVLAGGVGITLTRASDVVFVERSWTPAAEEQAEDRVHRIGQTDTVNVRYLMVPGTIDEDMDELLEDKRQVIASILDRGGSLEGVSTDIRAELARRWKNRRK
jgi:SWI/SNF-related matrix-associated actin-dependent regulator 1 of chromatin subfamily A